MSTSVESKRQKVPAAGQLLLCICALLLMVGLMYYSFTYPYPSGKPPDLSSFVALWLREILILGIFVACLFIGLAAWLFKLFRRISARGKNAP